MIGFGIKMNTGKFLNNHKNKKYFGIFFIVLIAFLFFITSPIGLSSFQICEYLILKNGNIQREYSIFNIIYYKSEKNSELSSTMHIYSDALPANRLLIRKRAGLWRIQLKSAKCYTELAELILNHRINSTNISKDEILDIINKYSGVFLPIYD